MMNSPAQDKMNGEARRRSFRYSPGAINAQTWYKTHGEAMKSEATSGT